MPRSLINDILTFFLLPHSPVLAVWKTKALCAATELGHTWTTHRQHVGMECTGQMYT